MSFLLAMVLFVPVCIALYVVFWMLRIHLARSGLPPMPEGLVPLIGHGLRLQKMLQSGLELPAVFNKLASDPGVDGVFTLCLPTPTVVITKPAALRDLLTGAASKDCSERIDSSKAHRFTTISMLGDNGQSNGIIGTRGKTAKIRRQLMLHRVFSERNMKQVLDPVVQCEVVKFLQLLTTKKGVDRAPTYLSDCCQRFALNVICAMTVNETFGPESEMATRIMEYTQSFLAQILKPHPTDLYPAVNYIYKKHVDFILAMNRERDAIFMPFVEKHRLAQAAGTPPQDFLDYAIQDGDKGEPLSDMDLVRLIQDMITAGTETTANSILFILGVVANRPEVQRRMQRELDEECGGETDSRLVEWTDRDSVPFTQSVIKEAIRLHPAARMIVPHVAVRDTHIDGHPVKAGTPILGLLSNLATDPEMFGDGKSGVAAEARAKFFDPDRFATAPALSITGKDDFAPFGAGTRSCLGFKLARVEIFLGVANALHCFDISPLRGDSVDLTERFASTAYPATPIELKFQARRAHLLQ